MRYVIGMIVFMIIGIGLYFTIQDKREQEMRKAQAEFVEAYMAEYKENRENQGPTLFQEIYKNYGDLDAMHRAMMESKKSGDGQGLENKRSYNHARDEAYARGAAVKKFRESQE